jgi:4-carboxymuconolactone decarboxylase
VILSFGSVWQADYELYAHGASAHAAGLSAEAVAALKSGRLSAELTPQEALAQRLALALTQRRAVDDGLYREGVASFGEGGLVDLVVLAGCYELICGLLNLFTIPAPAGEPKE